MVTFTERETSNSDTAIKKLGAKANVAAYQEKRLAPSRFADVLTSVLLVVFYSHSGTSCT